MNLTVDRLARVSLIVLCGAGIFFGALYFKLLAATVTATWSYDYTQTPSCSTSGVSDCIDHFELRDITSQESPRSIQSVSNPSSATGKVDGITTKFKYGPPYGKITFSVVAVKRGKNGELVSSNPFAARTTVSIRPGFKASLRF